LADQSSKTKTFSSPTTKASGKSKGITAVTSVPSLDARNGMIQDGMENLITVPIDPAAQKYLPFYHLPTVRGLREMVDTPRSTVSPDASCVREFLHTDWTTTFLTRTASSAPTSSTEPPFTTPDGVNDVLYSVPDLQTKSWHWKKLTSSLLLL